jgi:hypothetical protein
MVSNADVFGSKTGLNGATPFDESARSDTSEPVATRLLMNALEEIRANMLGMMWQSRGWYLVMSDGRLFCWVVLIRWCLF